MAPWLPCGKVLMCGEFLVPQVYGSWAAQSLSSIFCKGFFRTSPCLAESATLVALLPDDVAEDAEVVEAEEFAEFGFVEAAVGEGDGEHWPVGEGLVVGVVVVAVDAVFWSEAAPVECAAREFGHVVGVFDEGAGLGPGAAFVVADADVVYAHDVDEVDDVIDELVEGGCGGFVLDEAWDDGDAEEAALVCDGLCEFVALSAVVVGECLCVGVADDYGRGGEFDSVPADRFGAVADVDDHIEFVEAFDDGSSEVGDAAGVVFGAAVSDEVAEVVGELDLSESEVVEDVDAVEVGGKGDGVLEVDDESVLAVAVCALDVVCAEDEDEFAVEGVEDGACFRHALECGFEGGLDAGACYVRSRADGDAGGSPEVEVFVCGGRVGLDLTCRHARQDVACCASIHALLMEACEGGAHGVVEEEAGRRRGLLGVDDEGLVVELARLCGGEGWLSDRVADGLHGEPHRRNVE